MNFLLELGTEELPPGAGQAMSEAVRDAIRAVLRQHDLDPDAPGIQYRRWFTPRRIAVMALNIPAGSADRMQQVRGPAKDAPNAAIQGFCRKHGVRAEQLQTDAEGRLVLEQTLPGRPMAELLAEALPDATHRMPKGQTMRWGDGAHDFIRPVRWVLALLDHQVVEMRLFGLQSGRQTYAHRIHAPEPIEIADCDSWAERLRANKVEPDAGERQKRIQAGAAELAKSAAGLAVLSEDLLGEIADLVEWPQPLLCSYDGLGLPDEVVVAVLEKHQRCIPVRGQAGLLPHFIAVANLQSSSEAAVIRGNERVVRPRLEDAAFFYRQDRTLTAREYLDRLPGLMFHRKLGSMADKSERLVQLVDALSVATSGEAASDILKTAARYCKTDQVSLMVQEFPELEGTMAAWYLGDEVDGTAFIAQHYEPRNAESPLPDDISARLLALADKLDSLVGFFAAGEKVTASRDPMGMRRLALGISRLLVGDAQSQLDIRLEDLVSLATAQYPKALGAGKVQQEIADFIWDRFVDHRHPSHPHAPQLLAASRSQATGLGDALARLSALIDCEGSVCLEGYRRCHNILRKSGDAASEQLPPLADNAEAADKKLHAALLQTAEQVNTAVSSGDYAAVTSLLEELSKRQIAPFFERAMIEADDEDLRQMRYGMLRYTKSIYHRLADFSQIIGLEGY